MKTKSTLFFIIVLMITISLSAQVQKVNFSGEWKLNREKTVLADNQLFLSKISLNLKNDSLLTTRVYENGNGEEYPFKENLSLNGKDCKIVIYDMPRSSKTKGLNSEGSLIIESTTTFNGNNGEENFNSKETWKVDSGGKILTVNFTNKISGVETVGTYYYTKVK